MKAEQFNFEQSRRYWRLAPSGAGKHDTSSLISTSDHSFLSEWKNGFKKRFSNYVEEDEFLGVLGSEFGEKAILSIGSGLGFHEIYYASRGAQITCYDIVPTNLQSIQRVSTMLGLNVQTRLLEADTRFDPVFDRVFIYGSLMTMPQAAQKDLLDRVGKALKPGGRMILMLYTWEFARATCGWTHQEQFDPEVFARASDPSVGDEHCPWSDWHDDERILALMPPGFHISRRQFWQDNWFVWYEMSPQPAAVTPARAFTEPSALAGELIESVDLSDFEPIAATADFADGRLQITTEINLASYAARSAVLHGERVNVVSADYQIAEGAFSIGVLDEASGAFVASCPARDSASALRFAVPRQHNKVRLIVSNFRDSPASSRFTISSIRLGHRKSVSGEFVEQVVNKTLDAQAV